jgi:tRNA dimethylallyltransferase
MRYPVEHPVVILFGPTAVGKTGPGAGAGGASWTPRSSLPTSRLFYRGMDIAPQTSPQDAVVRSHHLIDIAEPDQTYSLRSFQREALRIIVDIQTRGKLPLVLAAPGSTCAPSRKAEHSAAAAGRAYARGIEAWAEEIDAQALHARLALLDPARPRPSTGATGAGRCARWR